VTRRPTEVKFTFRASKEHDGKTKRMFDSEVQTLKRKVRWNTTVQFSISYSDVGNPSAKHFCRIGSRPLTDPEVRKY
uniref:PLAT domain-containing protein n=1 Tax=Macrostomum lignano TaxID=282301 RepID=A0A1I8GMR4_9PLAT